MWPAQRTRTSTWRQDTNQCAACNGYSSHAVPWVDFSCQAVQIVLRSLHILIPTTLPCVCVSSTSCAACKACTAALCDRLSWPIVSCCFSLNPLSSTTLYRLGCHYHSFCCVESIQRLFSFGIFCPLGYLYQPGFCCLPVLPGPQLKTKKKRRRRTRIFRTKMTVNPMKQCKKPQESSSRSKARGAGVSVSSQCCR